MTRVLLSLGSNTGNPAQQLAQALEHLGAMRGVKVIRSSKPVVTPPWGKTDQPDFLNCAVVIDTDQDVVLLMENILSIEEKMGRVREEKWGPRSIDIDIILFGDEIVTTPTVVVPHPYLHERRFVLEPAAEIAPDMVHPGFQKSIATLLAECTDNAFAVLSK